MIFAWLLAASVVITEWVSIRCKTFKVSMSATPLSCTYCRNVVKHFMNSEVVTLSEWDWVFTSLFYGQILASTSFRKFCFFAPKSTSYVGPFWRCNTMAGPKSIEYGAELTNDARHGSTRPSVNYHKTMCVILQNIGCGKKRFSPLKWVWPNAENAQ